MNLTGGVILGFLYLLPGIAFVFGFTRVFNRKLPSPFDGQLSAGLVLALVASIALHTVASFLLHLIPIGPDPDVGEALLLLLGDYKSEPVQVAVTSAAKYWWAISLYFLILSNTAYRLGRWINTRAKSTRRADWYDLLTHDAAMLWLTTDIEINGAAYLYAGMLKDFKISADGDLERIVLLGAVRRPLARPSKQEIESGAEDYQEGGWISIPGEHVILSMASSRTVNIDYWYLDETESVDAQSPPDIDEAEEADDAA